jgi:hypothetical protein
LLLGKVAAVTGLSLIVTYHLARLVFDALLLIVIYRFLAMFTGARAVRRIAFLLIIFSGGLGWLLLLTGHSVWLGDYPIDLISPEAFTYLILLALPHLALARTLLLLGLMSLWQGERGTRHEAARRFAFHIPPFVLAGVCWLGMGLLVPFDIAVVGAIVSAGLIADAIAHRRINWRAVRRALLAGLIAAPILIYTFVLVGTDPIWQVWAAQLIILSPHPLHYVAGYLLMGILALFGIFRSPHSATPALHPQRGASVRNPQLLGWIVIVPFLIYLPFNSQRRLIESWQIPLIYFAAIGLVYVGLPAWRRSRFVKWLSGFRRYSVHGLRSWLLTSLVIFSAATYVLLLVDQSMRMMGQTPPSFRDGHEVEALRWLDQRVTFDDVILSSFDTGNYLPAQVDARAFLGHGPETAHSRDKSELVAKFYDSATADDWRRQFLSEWPITYVLVGPLEKALGDFDPTHTDYLALEYDQAGYQIYRVMRTAP